MYPSRHRLTDHGLFVECITGPGANLSMDCHCADLSADGRVDLIDFSILQRAFTGP